MTREEAIESFNHSNEQAKVRLVVEKMRMDISEVKELEFYIERNEMAIEALEQCTVPFDFDLYQAGLMDMPEGMIEVLDKIRAEIEALPKIYPFVNHIDTYVKEDNVKKIIDKYKTESEE